jgi:hypothetical protein
MNLLPIVGAILFSAGILYTFITVGKATGTSSNTEEMKSAINTVMIINIVMTVILAGIAIAYITANPTAERPYMLAVVHLSLLLSIISASITSLQKLDLASVVTTSGSGTTGGCPSS